MGKGINFLSYIGVAYFFKLSPDMSILGIFDVIGATEIIITILALIVIFILFRKLFPRSKKQISNINQQPVIVEKFTSTVSSDHVFVSYNRKQSGFALSLAKDLATNGVNVWIDQINIQAGEPWDNAIEKALISAPSVLVILSRDSVGSKNVLDEISYAIQHDKKIIPVLAEQCQLPMRLARLHNIDFTQEYKEGLSRLLRAINNQAK